MFLAGVLGVLWVCMFFFFFFPVVFLSVFWVSFLVFF